MTFRFAAARSAANLAARSPIARALSRSRNNHATNDNGELFSNDEVLEGALRHFAVHGLDAAPAAVRNAQVALAANNTSDYVWWLEICRTFDRGNARRLEREGRKVSNF